MEIFKKTLKRLNDSSRADFAQRRKGAIELRLREKRLVNKALGHPEFISGTYLQKCEMRCRNKFGRTKRFRKVEALP